MEAYTTKAILGGITMAMELEVAISSEGSRKTALFNHRRNQNCSQSSNCSRTGTGNCSEKAGYNDTYNGNSASAVPYTGIDKFYKASGDSRLCHNIAGKYKKRNRQQQKFTDTGIHISRNNGQRGS